MNDFDKISKGFYSINDNDQKNEFFILDYSIKKRSMNININRKNLAYKYITIDYLKFLNGNYNNSLTDNDVKYLKYFYDVFENINDHTKYIYSSLALKYLFCYNNSDVNKIISSKDIVNKMIIIKSNYLVADNPYLVFEDILHINPNEIMLIGNKVKFILKFKPYISDNEYTTLKTISDNESGKDYTYKDLIIQDNIFKINSNFNYSIEYFKKRTKLKDITIINLTNKKGNNLLQVYPQHYKFIFYFFSYSIHKKILVNNQNNKGETVLHNIINNSIPQLDPENNKDDCIEFYNNLLTNGFNISLKDKFNRSVLDICDMKPLWKDIILTRNNLNLLFLNEINNIKSKDWQGTYLQTLTTLIYFLEKYKKLSCTLVPKKFVSELIGITWSCDYTKGTHSFKIFDGFSEVYKDCLNSSSRFILIPLTLKHQKDENCKNLTDSTDHSNMIIIDKKNKTVERYEPHGKIINKKEWFDSETLDNKLKRLFISNNDNIKFWNDSNNDELKNIFKISNKYKFTYKIPEDICPLYGLQIYESEGFDPNNEVKKEGFCTAWSLYYTNIRLENPDIKPSQLLEYAKSSLSNYKFNIFINKYSFFLKSKLIEYSKSINQIACRLCVNQEQNEEAKERIMHTASIAFYQYKIKQIS